MEPVRHRPEGLQSGRRGNRTRSFVSHLRPKDHFARVMIVSGDRESEVRYLAEQVGITGIYAQKSPEDKLTIVHKEQPPPKRCTWGTGSMTPRP